MADSAGGDKIAIETVAGPDMALVDHWNEGTAKREIAEVNAACALLSVAERDAATGCRPGDRVVCAGRRRRERHPAARRRELEEGVGDRATLQMYADVLHPFAIGAYLAAATIYSKLLNKTPVGLPLTLRTRSGVQVSLTQAPGDDSAERGRGGERLLTAHRNQGIGIRE